MAAKSTNSQLTDTAVMISPDQFEFNVETAATNVFQNKSQREEEQQIRDAAIKEFHAMVDALRAEGITILVLPTRKDAVTPDAVFPNNWFSHHEDGTLVLYPMLNANRRAERQVENLQELLATVAIVPRVLDMSADEKKEHVLEGTGSLVLDRAHKIVYAMESPRTTKIEFDKWCQKMGYEGVFFHAYDKASLPIYHTNVVMSVGDGFAVAAPDTIKDVQERELLVEKLRKFGREFIPITVDQVYAFCGNILHMKSKNGDPKIIMSMSAYNAFDDGQKGLLKKYGEIITVKIPTIEKIGGGSARCMLAEVFP